MPHTTKGEYKPRPGHVPPKAKKPKKSLKGKMVMARSESGHTGY